MTITHNATITIVCRVALIASKLSTQSRKYFTKGFKVISYHFCLERNIQPLNKFDVKRGLAFENRGYGFS